MYYENKELSLRDITMECKTYHPDETHLNFAFIATFQTRNIILIKMFDHIYTYSICNNKHFMWKPG